MKIEKYLVVKDFYRKHGNMEILHKKGEVVNSTHLTDPTHMLYVQPLSSADGENSFSAKWAIKRTPENAEVVNGWANEKIKDSKNIIPYAGEDQYFHYPSLQLDLHQDYKHLFYSLRDGYTEIDFETFKEITGMGEEKKFKVGDWVVGWHCDYKSYMANAWKIENIKEEYETMYASPRETEWTNFHLLRHAKPDEIAEATQPKIFTIEDVRNGKCAIKNDGQLKDIKLVLSLCFPHDMRRPTKNDVWNFYSRSEHIKNSWMGSQKTQLPTQSVKLFLSQIESEKEQPIEEWQPKNENEFSPKWGKK